MSDGTWFASATLMIRFYRVLVLFHLLSGLCSNSFMKGDDSAACDGVPIFPVVAD